MKGFSRTEEERAQTLHRKATVIAAHSDGAMCDIAERRAKGERSVFDKNHVPYLKEGGVDAILETVGGTTLHLTFPLGRHVLSSASNHMKRTFVLIDMMLSDLEECRTATLARTANDIRRSKREGSIAVMMSFEGGDPIEDDLGLLRIYHRLGVRSMQLAWIDRNMIVDSYWERTNSGLTNFGVSVIEEMNKIGMLIDLAHISEKGFMDVLEQTKDPVIASHCNTRAVCDHARNLSDEKIKALAENRGVIGLNANFVSMKEKPTIEDMIDHIDHIVKLVGPNHIGIGFDINENFDKEIYRKMWRETVYKFAWSYPENMDSMSRTPNLTKMLVARGYSDQEILKILGGNYLRVFEEVFGS